MDINFQLEQLVFRSHHISFTSRPSEGEANIEANTAALDLEISEAVPDSLDRSIIAELCYDGRISSRELARKYNVNAGTIRYRIKALETRKLLSLQTIVDPGAVGLRCFSQILMEVVPSKLNAVTAALEQKPWLPFLLHTTGRSNLVGLMLTTDFFEAEDLAVQELRTLDGVQHLSVVPLTRNYKVDARFA